MTEFHITFNCLFQLSYHPEEMNKIQFKFLN